METQRRSRIRSKRRLIVGCVSVVIVAGLVVQGLRYPLIRAWLNPEYRTQVLRFGEALFLTEALYIDEDRARHDQLTEQALIGMTTSLDKHSLFMPAEAFDQYKQDQDLSYSGTGFRSWRFQGEHVVARVFSDSPAHRAGLVAGDRIVKINGKTVSESTDQEFTRSMRGPVDSEVRLEVAGRGGDRSVAIRRTQIHMTAVDDHWVDSEGLGYLKLIRFTHKVNSELKPALERMQSEGMRGLILDLRGNPGGKLDATVEVAGFFLPPDLLIATLESRLPDVTREHRTPAGAIHLEIPLVVLIDEYSASGAELLAGALKFYDRAVLVGTKTYGKGSAQQVFPLSHNSGINLTFAKYNLPDGSNLDGKGLMPDHLVSWEPENEIQLRLQRDILGEIDPAEFRSQFGVDPLPDPQWLKAVELLRGAIRERQE